MPAAPNQLWFREAGREFLDKLCPRELPVIITGPEVDKLRQLGERAWLYVVTFCKSDKPRLMTIQDPITKLRMEVLFRQVQYMVSEDEWLAQGEEAES
ncbi:MAG: hypothetical protein NTX53_03230 [candidate division WOR-3 bacterium]|nr:hypothetical protein [candidate division WOR-3 bacterium]